MWSDSCDLPEDHDHAALLRHMLEVGKTVGSQLLELQGRRHELEVTNKSGTTFLDLVTEADLAIDRTLCERLQTISDLPYASEESELKDKILEIDGPFWLADPIDGTNNFINGMPMCGTTFAMIDSGHAVAAVSVFPALELTFYGLRGGGAWCNGERMAIRSTEAENWIVEVCSQPQDAQLLGNAVAMVAGCRAMRIIGSMALSLAWVAAGKLDLFMGRGYPWDVAAGMLFIQEAGGESKTLNRDFRNPLKKQLMVAGHSDHVTEAIARIQGSGS